MSPKIDAIVTAILSIVIAVLLGIKAYPPKRDIPMEITGLEGEVIELNTPPTYKVTTSNDNLQIINNELKLYKIGTTEVIIKDGYRKYKIDVTINPLPGTRITIYDHKGEPYTKFRTVFSSTDGKHELQTLWTNEIVIPDTVKDNTQVIAMFEDKTIDKSIYLVNIKNKTEEENNPIVQTGETVPSEEISSIENNTIITIGDLIIEPIEGATYIKNNRVYVTEEITNMPFGTDTVDAEETTEP